MTYHWMYRKKTRRNKKFELWNGNSSFDMHWFKEIAENGRWIEPSGGGWAGCLCVRENRNTTAQRSFGFNVFWNHTWNWLLIMSTYLLGEADVPPVGRPKEGVWYEWHAMRYGYHQRRTALLQFMISIFIMMLQPLQPMESVCHIFMCINNNITTKCNLINLHMLLLW